MEKEDRFIKARRYLELKREQWFLEEFVFCSDFYKENFFVKIDVHSLAKANQDEQKNLFYELYPEPPKDLFEDVKKRQEKMKDVKYMKQSSWQAVKVKKGFLARIFCR